MRRLFPVPRNPAHLADPAAAGGPEGARDAEPSGGAWSLAEIADAYAYPEPLDGRWLRANMVSSLDGAAVHDGRSQPLSSPADMRIFGVLRSLADVILVGAQTVRQEEYRPTKVRREFAELRAARGQTPAAAIAVVSARLELDFTLPLFTSPTTPTLVVTGAQAPTERVAAARAAGARVVFAGVGEQAAPGEIPGALAELGLRRQLTEGGPRLLAELVAADVVDEVCLSLAPRLAGGDSFGILTGPTLPTPAEFRLGAVVEEDGFLFTRYLRSV